MVSYFKFEYALSNSRSDSFDYDISSSMGMDTPNDIINGFQANFRFGSDLVVIFNSTESDSLLVDLFSEKISMTNILVLLLWECWEVFRTLETKAIILFVRSYLSLKVISKVCKQSMSSSTSMLLKSWVLQ